MSKLLLDEHPILILPQLASSIGLNESIILQQVHYWIQQNTKKGRNHHDGYYWTYNTFDEWEKQFPFWSGRTIKRNFKKLEERNLLVIGDYNKKSYDRTKWYRIDYKTLETIHSIHSDKVTLCNVTDWHNGEGQNGTMDSDRMAPTIPETNTEINSETNYIYTLFNHWNSQGIIKHRELTAARKSATNARLKTYTKEELMNAVTNYKSILDSEDYYWTYKWTYEQFMKPGNVERFTDEADPFSNFKKRGQKEGAPYQSLEDKYDPEVDSF